MKKIVFSVVLIVLLTPYAFAALKINDTAPTISLPDREGKEFSLSDVVGAMRKERGNGVVLSFFASWCMPCRNELPLLNSFVDELKGKSIKVVIVGVREDFDKIGALLTELKIDKPIVLSDRSGKMSEMYEVRFLPMTFFIGSDGKVKDMIFGEIGDATELRNSAEKLVK